MLPARISNAQTRHTSSSCGFDYGLLSAPMSGRSLPMLSKRTPGSAEYSQSPRIGVRDRAARRAKVWYEITGNKTILQNCASFQKDFD